MRTHTITRHSNTEATMTNHVTLTSCIQNIHVALHKHDEYRSNYQGLLALPLVQKLKRKNNDLKKEVRLLKQLLRVARGEDAITKKVLKTKNTSNLVSIEEKKDDDEEEDDDVVVVVKTEGDSEQERIVYEIEETDEPEPLVEEVKEQEEGEAEEEEVMVEEVEEVIVEEVVEEETEEEEEVVVEEVVEEEETEEEEVVETVEVIEEEEETEEEEEEFEEVVIKGVTYCTNDAQNGEIYAVSDEGELGDMVGNFVNGKAVFVKKAKK